MELWYEDRKIDGKYQDICIDVDYVQVKKALKELVFFEYFNDELKKVIDDKELLSKVRKAVEKGFGEYIEVFDENYDLLCDYFKESIHEYFEDKI